MEQRRIPKSMESLQHTPRNPKFDYFGCVLHAMSLDAAQHPEAKMLLSRILEAADLGYSLDREPGN